MARRFFFVCLGILCLVCAYQLGADRARADWDANAPGEIVGGGQRLWFTRDGEAWRLLETSMTWERQDPALDLPVPASEVKFMDNVSGAGIFMITTEDVAWFAGGAGPWEQIGPFPGAPVPLKTDSWGKVKDRYRE